MANPENIPYFIQVRGCINCSASKSMKEKHGSDYGFDHEINVKCVMQNCKSKGYSLAEPFIDPEQLVNYVKKNPSPKSAEKVKEILQNYQGKFGKYFSQIGVNIQSLIQELN